MLSKGKRATQRAPQLVILAEDNQQVTKPRRHSARLSALRSKEEVVEESKIKESTEVQPKENKYELKKRRRAADLKVSSSKQPATKRVRTTTSRGSRKTKGKHEEQKSSVELLREKQEREEKLCLIHPNFRLERLSFDGKNLTTGIATVDRASLDDVLLAAPYVADMFQNLFRQEVRRIDVHDQSVILNSIFSYTHFPLLYHRGGHVHECTWKISQISMQR